MNTDLQLVEQARKGNLSSFKILVEQNKRLVYNLAFDLTKSREDAEDVSQDVFVKAFRSLDKFRGDSKFSTWLYRITVNTCLSMKRKKSYSTMQTEEDMNEVIAANEKLSVKFQQVNPERVTESNFIKKNIDKAMQKLSERERTVFVMRNFNELPFEEIVQALKLKAGTVRSLNFRAIKKLQKELSFYNQEPQAEGANE